MEYLFMKEMRTDFEVGTFLFYDWIFSPLLLFMLPSSPVYGHANASCTQVLSLSWTKFPKLWKKKESLLLPVTKAICGSSSMKGLNWKAWQYVSTGYSKINLIFGSLLSHGPSSCFWRSVFLSCLTSLFCAQIAIQTTRGLTMQWCNYLSRHLQ